MRRGFAHCLFPMQAKGDAYGNLVFWLRAFAGSPVLPGVRFIGSSLYCPPARRDAQSSLVCLLSLLPSFKPEGGGHYGRGILL